ncbi:TauD/TfdA dioxygenase family protein [Rhodopila sp.]|uniref:TauD/TfdA dioxygenase family protein n=1 Tax=Rhodopila sp. TaxID=2480087 RepID=UPI003D0A8BF0
MKIIPSGQTLGAQVQDIDHATALSNDALRTVLTALGKHGALCFPNQTFDTAAFAAFARRFGDLEVNVANKFHEPDFPEVMILSNRTDPAGKPVGLNDAGQGWHTDMSYSKDIALANVLHAQAVPMRNGKSVGETQFRNMHAAYDELPDEVKHKIEGHTATHDFEKFWEVMRLRPGSHRARLTNEQRRKKPPVSQPLVRIHPLTARKVLYANPGYTMWIDGIERSESDTILDYLFRHQERADFLYAHHWAVGDLLMWDNIGTVHNAVADYMPNEPRYMRRAQVMATLDYTSLLQHGRDGLA